MSDASDKIRTNPPKPTAVTLSQPTSDKTTSLEVTWSMIGTAYIVSSYIINLTPANGGSNAPIVTYTATSTDPTNYTVDSLTPGESYTVTVQAVSNDPTTESKSEISTQSAAQRTDPSKPTAVTLSQPTSDKTTSLEVTWSMIGTAYIVSSYIINLTPANGGSNAPIVTYTATSTDPTNKIVGGLTPGESYTATVQAVSNDPTPESKMKFQRRLQLSEQ
uniref:Fibronectin type-III domain-containing protein n=1 Tax=Ciona savignyi TaxID=51511 RepID=H2ZLG0_CIOSA